MRTREHVGTQSVALDSRKCKACWICIDACPRQVIGRVNLPWHKHAIFVNSEKCSGCLTCLKKCPHGAYSKTQ